jgi:hypothetical protein
MDGKKNGGTTTMAVYLSGSDEPSRYVQHMIGELKLTLTAAQHASYLEAARFVAKAGKAPLDIPKLHELMLRDVGGGGKYREGVVLDSVTCAVKMFPRATAVPQLMYRVKNAYRKALQPDVLGLDTSQREDMFWMIAANGRCLHPFEVRNTRLFCLVENHLRQTQGLPWRMGLRPQEQFRTFRERYKKENAEFYNE